MGSSAICTEPRTAALRAAASEHYGHAGPEIVRVILGSDPKVLRKKHAEILELFQTTNAQEIRVARMFAAAALARRAGRGSSTG